MISILRLCENRGCTSFHPLIALQIPVVCQLLSFLETTLFDQCFKLSSFHLKSEAPQIHLALSYLIYWLLFFLLLIICRK
ncbi:hypothetical protein BDV38DRAFT_211229 [Aspergillus pseudotamarii]|uniref:Uncharacterized protein n=1 Tax=Aspergillus pseudotamarii TaxID=132259 RepID=A0A5N6SF83_ASPPS|nr:uncharacterized protein BDV38DRAFT_211229 [Aspergillus pseudotamarii]KAE8132370.1 hypothetical protein BDV38DRAFT_211229 [Aspergillus pseudotamarii]